MKKKIIPIFIPHQGCPNDCVFCNQKRITGKGVSIDFEEIKSDIEVSLKTIKPDVLIEIAFFGGSFTAISIEIQRKCLEIANYYKNIDDRISDIRISTRPDAINGEILEFLKKYNVSIIELGVQSLDNQVLISSERGHNAFCVYTSSSLIKKYGFTLGLQMMVGLPDDTEEKAIFTAKESVKIKPDYVRIYPVLVIKDTKLEEQMICNEYTPITVEQAIEIVKKIYVLFEKNNIKVIRIGLQASTEINENASVIAGPFHPAFGELVFSRLYRDYLEFFFRKDKNVAGVFLKDEVEVSKKKILHIDSSEKAFKSVILNDNNFEKETFKDIVVQVNKSLISQFIGNKKENIKYIYEKFNIKLKIKENNALNSDELILNNVNLSLSDIYNRLFLSYFKVGG